MKKYLILSLSLCLFFSSCHKKVAQQATEQTTKIEITNPIADERQDELAEVQLADLLKDSEQITDFCLYNEQGKAIPYQAMYYGNEQPQSIVFQVSVKGNAKTIYELRKGQPTPAKAKVFARFVPERKDDFAWENDRAAYRMYGPALADENPSNGVDLWLKCTDELIVDTFYINELQYGQSYHINHGKGLDCYKVEHTLGCGGIAPYKDGKLLIGDYFTDYQILEQGALRTQFYLNYPEMTFLVTVDAGAQLNKAEVIYTGEADRLAAGIYLHDVIDHIQDAQENGWAAYAENAVSDAGVPQGRNYAAIVMPTCDTIITQDNSLLCLTPYEMGDVLTYYFGGGWSQWQYPTDSDWFEATAHTARCIAHPLQIKVQR